MFLGKKIRTFIEEHSKNESPYFKIIDGALMNNELDTLIYYPINNTNKEYIVLPTIKIITVTKALPSISTAISLYFSKSHSRTLWAASGKKIKSLIF